MSNAMREKIEELVDFALEEIRKGNNSEEQKNELGIGIMDLLCSLPENIEILKIRQ